MYFIRHGQSLGNQLGVFLGHTDLDLSELGYRQAACTAQYLKDIKIDKVYSSDLLRAYNTCGEYLKVTGKEAEKTTELREIFVGQWENQPFEYLQEHFKQSYGIWLSDLGSARPEDGESIAELEQRIVRFCERVAKENDGKTVALFTHATVIRAFFNYAYGRPLKEIQNLHWVTNASVSSVVYCDGKFTVSEYGTDGFLSGLKTELPTNV